jgi:hypothetical protein
MLQHGPKSIKKLGAKLAQFAVNHPSLRFTLEEASDAQPLLGYLAPYAFDIVNPGSSTGSQAELQLYLDYKVAKNLTKLLEGLIFVCIPTQHDDLCVKGLHVYVSALAALNIITKQARAQATPQGQAVALKLLHQLQPEDHEEAPGMLR